MKKKDEFENVITETEIKRRLDKKMYNNKNAPALPLFSEREMWFICNKKKSDWKDLTLAKQFRTFIKKHGALMWFKSEK